MSLTEPIDLGIPKIHIPGPTYAGVVKIIQQTVDAYGMDPFSNLELLEAGGVLNWARYTIGINTKDRLVQSPEHTFEIPDEFAPTSFLVPVSTDAAIFIALLMQLREHNKGFKTIGLKSIETESAIHLPTAHLLLPPTEIRFDFLQALLKDPLSCFFRGA